MIKKMLSYIFIIFGLVVLYMSTSRKAMEFVAANSDHDKWWGTYQMKNGDLISLSYLDFVHKFNPPRDHTPIKKPIYNGEKNIALYLHGDSYTYHLPRLRLCWAGRVSPDRQEPWHELPPGLYEKKHTDTGGV